jgi:uncharacterized protein (TIGR03067 family)
MFVSKVKMMAACFLALSLLIAFAFGVIQYTALAEKPASSRETADQGNADQEKLRGSWVVVTSDNSAGDENEKYTGNKLKFEDGKFEIDARKNHDRGPQIQGAFQLAPGKSPKQIDLTVPEKGNRPLSEGIYSLDGDNLKLCLGMTNERPKEFTVKDSSNRFLWVLKREKP